MSSSPPAAPAAPHEPAQPIQPALPASARIRQRLQAARCRHHANDNIAAFVHEGELEELKAEVQAKAQELLHALVIDTEGDHNTHGTAERLARMYIDEVFRGRYQPMPAVTEFPNAERLNELMIVGPITVRSACSHHLCPIMGRVWVGLLPNEHSNLIGLSKYARICDWVMSRPQIQEEAVMMLANELQQRVRPDGLAIVMEADHFCMHWRGVKDDETAMVNSVMRGAFLKDANLRREFLSLLSRKGTRPAPATRRPIMLVRLMYASRPAPALDAEELAAILRGSRENNPQHGITGVLCVGDGVFVQVLEGSRSAVNRLYQLIAADARHKQLELLSYEEIRERRYATRSPRTSTPSASRARPPPRCSTN